MKDKNRETEEFFTCSGTDCTGLIPAGLVSEDEREAYEELYPSLTPPVLNKEGEAEQQFPLKKNWKYTAEYGKITDTDR